MCFVGCHTVFLLRVFAPNIFAWLFLGTLSLSIYPLLRSINSCRPSPHVSFLLCVK